MSEWVTRSPIELFWTAKNTQWLYLSICSGFLFHLHSTGVSQMAFSDAQCDLHRAEFYNCLPFPHQYPQPEHGPRHRETEDWLNTLLVFLSIKRIRRWKLPKSSWLSSCALASIGIRVKLKRRETQFPWGRLPSPSIFDKQIKMVKQNAFTRIPFSNG